MNLKFNPYTLVVLLAIVSIAGCSGGTSGTGTGDDGNTGASADGFLVEVGSDEQLRSYLVAGAGLDDPSHFALPLAEADEIIGDSILNNSFSTTNLVEAGIDEADRVKYDGRYLFVAERRIGTGNVKVTVYDTDPSVPSASALTTITLPTTDAIDGLYLYQDTLTIITRSQGYIWEGRRWASSGYWNNNKASVFIYDISNPANPTPSAALTFDGRLLETRRIGQYIYLINRHSPDINPDVLDGVNIAELLPQLTSNLQSSPWFDATDCYVPAELVDDNASAIITVISTIDVTNSGSINARCYTGKSTGFYTSSNAIYLSRYSPERLETDIHKFAFQANNVEYVGSGSVPGNLDGRNPQFRMNEYDGYLRVVSDARQNIWNVAVSESMDTPVDTDPQFEHYLSVLAPVTGSNALEVVAQIPSANNPNSIGKPGEAVYAVRFVGERAYIVTFMRTDPFYVVDLSDPLAPTIAGELEIPGFSTLLQPIGADYMLGLGRTNSRVKLELFDISDASDPQSVDLITLNTSYSNALYDHHALTLLPQADGITTRIAIPLAADYCGNDASLQLAEVDTSSGSLTNLGIILPQDLNAFPSRNERSVLVNDAVFYLYGNDITSAFWSDGQINTDCVAFLSGLPVLPD
ncbi:MAG: beta-propeller domain-containing protein [Pseudomonadales bacterium]